MSYIRVYFPDYSTGVVVIVFCLHEWASAVGSIPVVQIIFIIIHTTHGFGDRDQLRQSNQNELIGGVSESRALNLSLDDLFKVKFLSFSNKSTSFIFCRFVLSRTVSRWRPSPSPTHSQ